MLNRRPKRRYLAIMHVDAPSNTLDKITKRCSELFGSIATEKAAIRLVKSENNFTIIRCTLAQLDNVLVSIALSERPVVTFDMSGSMKRLSRRVV